MSLDSEHVDSVALFQGLSFVPERARQWDDVLWRSGTDLWTGDVGLDRTTLPILLSDDPSIETNIALTGTIEIRRAVSMDSGSYKSTSTCHGLTS